MLGKSNLLALHNQIPKCHYYFLVVLSPALKYDWLIVGQLWSIFYHEKLSFPFPVNFVFYSTLWLSISVHIVISRYPSCKHLFYFLLFLVLCPISLRFPFSFLLISNDSYLVFGELIKKNKIYLVLEPTNIVIVLTCFQLAAKFICH